MIRDITLGQYYKANSIIHSLDARTKILGTLAYLISLFFINSIVGYVLATIFLVLIIKLSKVPFKFMIRGLKSIIFLMLITVIFNLFLTNGTVLVRIWKLKITEEGLRLAVFMALRLMYLIIGASIMTLTTTPNKLTDGIERLLWPLAKIKVPVHEIAMMMSISLRFIPILLEETNKIIIAQKARGADFDEKGIVKKAKGMIPILIPLFVSAFRRASDLATAMEARCYHGGDGRTKLNPLKYTIKDLIALIIFIIYFALLILIKKFVIFKIWIF